MNKKRLYTTTCAICKKQFYPHNRTQKYCSQECFNKVRSRHRTDRVTLTCSVCSSKFEVRKYRAKTAHYCSKECWSNRSPIRKKDCEFCGSKFETYDDNQRFCSQSCAGKSRTGKNANAYKDGKAASTKRGKLSGELAKWRKKVYQRDNYTCQKCGTKGEIHAHHIKELSKFPEFALDIDNGLTVCVPCHEKIHGRKISSPGRYKKHCEDCGAKTTGRSLRCRSCSIAYSWQTKRKH